jgi:hypothetical protein
LNLFDNVKIIINTAFFHTFVFVMMIAFYIYYFIFIILYLLFHPAPDFLR